MITAMTADVPVLMTADTFQVVTLILLALILLLLLVPYGRRG
jgi:hypothetical protein